MPKGRTSTGRIRKGFRLTRGGQVVKVKRRKGKSRRRSRRKKRR